MSGELVNSHDVPQAVINPNKPGRSFAVGAILTAVDTVLNPN